MRLRRADGRTAAAAMLCLSICAGSLWAGADDFLAESGYGGYKDGHLRRSEIKPGQWRRKPCPLANIRYKVPVARYPAITKPRLPGPYGWSAPVSGRAKLETDMRNRFEMPVELQVRIPSPDPRRGRFELPRFDRYRFRFPLPSLRFRKPVYQYKPICRP